ncbi:hypothetical protein EsH8_III_000078 [Colletotrichum jinshuiense]
MCRARILYEVRQEASSAQKSWYATMTSLAFNASRCANLASATLTLLGAKFLSVEANLVANYSFDVPKGWVYSQPSLDVHNATFCNVTVTYTHPGQNDSLRVEAWLPTEENYNGIMQSVGGGGWVAGRFILSYAAMTNAVANGYATVTTDAGIPTGNNPADWLLATIAKQLIVSFYGKGPSYSYWNGCSQGGRQGLKVAQQYPNVYDGIMSAAPAVNWAEFYINSIWPIFYMENTQQFPLDCALNALTSLAVSICDELDGVKDGLISDPEACRESFDPFAYVGASFECSSTGSMLNITEAAAAVANASWTGPRFSNGKFLYDGFEMGSDLSTIAPTNCTGEICAGVGLENLVWAWQTFVAKDPNATLPKLTGGTFDTIYRAVKLVFASNLETDEADLSDFKNAGGKLITYHGLADQSISPGGTLRYYNKVADFVGNISSFYKYYRAYPLSKTQPRTRLVVVEHACADSDSSSRKQSGEKNDSDETSGWKSSFFRVVEGSATALGSIAVLGLAGYSYHAYYKDLVLRKMDNAFAAGFSTPELTALGRHVAFHKLQSGDSLTGFKSENEWIPRGEQPLIDGIIDGSVKGEYHLITGEKGTGKTSMILKAMRKVNGEGIAMLEAHSDPEVFRLRLGKALDFEFHEDYIGSLFNFKGPRDSTAILDIERAFNKMEKVALMRQARIRKPLILIINRIHVLRDDEDGRNLLDLIQQRAELWAASRLVTVVFTSDDHSTTEHLKWQATRMTVSDVHDVPRGPALEALREFRSRVFKEDVPEDTLDCVYKKVGGRVRFLDHVARSKDMLATCDFICEREKRWLLGQCWILGEEMSDDAEEQQDYSATAFVLAKALVEREKAMLREGVPDGQLPEIPLHKARELMTRWDVIQRHDHFNIFSIDSRSMVRADSVPMQNAFRDICAQAGFEEHLQATLDRLDELEGLQRTREIVMKDLLKEGEFKAVIRQKQENGEPLTVAVKTSSSKEDASQ